MTKEEVIKKSWLIGDQICLKLQNVRECKKEVKNEDCKLVSLWRLLSSSQNR